jgi:hypothetical protein
MVKYMNLAGSMCMLNNQQRLQDFANVTPQVSKEHILHECKKVSMLLIVTELLILVCYED